MNELYLTPSCLGTSFLVTKSKQELCNYINITLNDENFKPEIHCNHCKSVKSKWYQPIRLLCDFCYFLIKRDSEYYTNGIDNYCSLDCITKMKVEVKCFKTPIHNKSNEEELIMCSYCNKPYHVSCGMINTYTRCVKNHDDFMCAFCMLELMRDVDSNRLVNKMEQSAFNLPKTNLSSKMEDYVQDSSIIIRHVSSIKEKEKEEDVIFVFQKLNNGFEVLIFIIYVEFWLDCTESIPGNKNTMYISYLDSVGFYTPAGMRTVLYQNCLLCVMDYAAKTKGTRKCFLWACPPEKGVEFIYNARPAPVIVDGMKKKSKKPLLIAWYHGMFNLGKQRGIVLQHMKLCDYFKREDITKVEQCSFYYGDFVSMTRDSFQGLKKKKMKGRGQNKREVTLFEEIHGEISKTYNMNGLLMCYLNPPPVLEKSTDVTIDSPLTRNRLTFHNMLVDNMLQFNDLQHATHSTSMILFFLYNPTKLFSVERCNSCLGVIHNEFDVEYSCNECVNPAYVICEHCFLMNTHGHHHPIVTMDVSILKKMEALNHVMQCVGCDDASCRELKTNLLHTCDSFGICNTCKRLGLVDHSMVCVNSNCALPNCLKIKNLFKKQEGLYNNSRLNNYKKEEEEDEQQ